MSVRLDIDADVGADWLYAFNFVTLADAAIAYDTSGVTAFELVIYDKRKPRAAAVTINDAYITANPTYLTRTDASGSWVWAIPDSVFVAAANIAPAGVYSCKFQVTTSAGKRDWMEGTFTRHLKGKPSGAAAGVTQAVDTNGDTATVSVWMPNMLAAINTLNTASTLAILLGYDEDTAANGTTWRVLDGGATGAPTNLDWVFVLEAAGATSNNTTLYDMDDGRIARRLWDQTNMYASWNPDLFTIATTAIDKDELQKVFTAAPVNGHIHIDNPSNAEYTCDFDAGTLKINWHPSKIHLYGNLKMGPEEPDNGYQFFNQNGVGAYEVFYNDYKIKGPTDGLPPLDITTVTVDMTAASDVIDLVTGSGTFDGAAQGGNGYDHWERRVVIKGAGAGGADLETYLKTWNNSAQWVVHDAASTTVTGAVLEFVPVVEATTCFNFSGATGRSSLTLHQGYITHDGLAPADGVGGVRAGGFSHWLKTAGAWVDVWCDGMIAHTIQQNVSLFADAVGLERNSMRWKGGEASAGMPVRSDGALHPHEENGRLWYFHPNTNVYMEGIHITRAVRGCLNLFGGISAVPEWVIAKDMKVAPAVATHFLNTANLSAWEGTIQIIGGEFKQRGVDPNEAYSSGKFTGSMFLLTKANIALSGNMKCHTLRDVTNGAGYRLDVGPEVEIINVGTSDATPDGLTINGPGTILAKYVRTLNDAGKNVAVDFAANEQLVIDGLRSYSTIDQTHQDLQIYYKLLIGVTTDTLTYVDDEAARDLLSPTSGDGVIYINDGADTGDAFLYTGSAWEAKGSVLPAYGLFMTHDADLDINFRHEGPVNDDVSTNAGLWYNVTTAGVKTHFRDCYVDATALGAALDCNIFGGDDDSISGRIDSPESNWAGRLTDGQLEFPRRKVRQVVASATSTYWKPSKSVTITGNTTITNAGLLSSSGVFAQTTQDLFQDSVDLVFEGGAAFATGGTPGIVTQNTSARSAARLALSDAHDAWHDAGN